MDKSPVQIGFQSLKIDASNLAYDQPLGKIVQEWVKLIVEKMNNPALGVSYKKDISLEINLNGAFPLSWFPKFTASAKHHTSAEVEFSYDVISAKLKIDGKEYDLGLTIETPFKFPERVQTSATEEFD